MKNIFIISTWLFIFFLNNGECYSQIKKPPLKPKSTPTLPKATEPKPAETKPTEKKVDIEKPVQQPSAITKPVTQLPKLNIPGPLDDLASLTMPIAPGQREITFNLGSQEPLSGLEVTVYYSKTNSADFNSTPSTMPHGNAIIILSQKGPPAIYSCRFVFPHTFFNAPNKRLYQRLGEINQPDLQPVSDLSLLDVNPQVINKGECVYFKIVKKATKSGTTTVTQSNILHFTMPDKFNIGIPGDSYGAGEGAPNGTAGVADSKQGIWEDCYCHRSNKSGQVRGTKLFIHNNPHVAVKYVHIACSGAIIQDFVQCRYQAHPDEEFTDAIRNCSSTIQGQVCNNDPRDKAPQFEVLKNEFESADQINMMIMNIGGNNAGFADFVMAFLLCPFNATGPLETGFAQDMLAEAQNKLNSMGNKYKHIDNALENSINSGKNFIKPIAGICTYPNPTSKQNNERCGCDKHDVVHDAAVVAAIAAVIAASATGATVAAIAGQLGAYTAAVAATALAAGVLENQVIHNSRYGALSYENGCLWSPRSEWQMLNDGFMIPLNKAVRENKDEFKWGIIEIENVMVGKGLCNPSDPRENGIISTIGKQGDIFGVVHPNSKGYELYVEPVEKFIQKKYEEYILTYALIVLNECIKITTTSCSMSDLERKAVAIALLNDNLNKLKKYADIKSSFNVLSLSQSAVLNSLLYSNISSIESQNFYTQLRSAEIKRQVCNSEMSKSIIAKTTPSNPLPPIAGEEDGPAFKKMKAQTRAFINSTDYKDLITIVDGDYDKLKPTDPIRLNSDYKYFLDNKYNEKTDNGK